MAYQYATGIAKNGSDLIIKLRDFVITTCGWTSVQDTVSTTGAAASYFVASSTGEDTNHKNVIRFLNNTTTLLTTGWLSWSAGNGKSGSGVGGAGAAIDANNYMMYWFFGSLDRIVVFVSSPGPTSIGTCYAGSYDTQRSANFAVTTNAESAGSAVVVEVNNTTYFTSGKRYVIADDNGYESPKISSINAGVSITFDVLQNSYLAGARVGEDPRPLVAVSGNTNPFSMGISQGANPVATPGTGGLPVAVNLGQVGSASFLVRQVDASLVEKGSEGMADGGPQLVDLFPLTISSESLHFGGTLGKLTEVYQVPRIGMATDDTIAVGGSTYHVIELSAANATTGIQAMAVAVRRS